MTAQEAFALLLKEEGQPVLPRELAERALQRGLVSSSSKDPVFSIATTVVKNIREQRYNEPELVFIESNEGRKIGLPRWQVENPTTRNSVSEKVRPLTVTLPPDVAQGVRLAVQAGLAATEQEAVTLLVKCGLADKKIRKDIRAGIHDQLKRLDAVL